MLVPDYADLSIKISLAHFTTLFRMVKEIPYLRNRMIGVSNTVLEPPSSVFSVSTNLYRKFVKHTLFRESGVRCASEETRGLENYPVVPKAPFQFTKCVEIRLQIPFSSSILHNLGRT